MTLYEGDNTTADNCELSLMLLINLTMSKSRFSLEIAFDLISYSLLISLYHSVLRHTQQHDFNKKESGFKKKTNNLSKLSQV